MRTGPQLQLDVHVGPRYAAITPLRAQLIAARPALADAGVFVPDLPRAPRAWNNLAWQLTDDRRFDPARSEWSRLLRAAADSGADRAIVMSDELAPMLRTPAAAARLREIAASAGARLRVLAVMRDPASTLNAAFGLRATALAVTTTFAEFVADPKPPRDFTLAGALGHLADVADDVRFVPYDAIESGDGLVALLRAAGGPVSPAETARYAPAPDPDVIGVQTGLLTARLISAHGKQADDQQRRGATELAGIVRDALPQAPGPFWGWTDELLERHRSRFVEDAEAFTERTGVSPPLPPDRPVQVPASVDLPAEAFATLIDGVRDLALGESPTSPLAPASPR